MAIATTSIPPAAAEPAPLHHGADNAATSLLFRVVLDEPGSIGVTLNRRSIVGTYGIVSGDMTSGFNVCTNRYFAVVKRVEPHSPSHRAGLRSGDVITYPGSGGAHPIPFDEFLSMCHAPAPRPPLVFDALRMAPPPPLLQKQAADEDEEHDDNDCCSTEDTTVTCSASSFSVCSSVGGLAFASTSGRGPLQPFPPSSIACPAYHPPPLTIAESLVAMTNHQIRLELWKRGIKGRSGSRDQMLTNLGLPVARWRAYRNMTMPELTAELEKRALKVTGTKEDMLERLGVPKGFNETRIERFNRHYLRKWHRASARPKEQVKGKPKPSLRPQDQRLLHKVDKMERQKTESQGGAKTRSDRPGLHQALLRQLSL